MPGYEFGFLINKTQHLGNIVCQSKNIATCADVNKGKSAIEEVVAHVYYISFSEKHHRITVSVPIGQMNELYMLIIDV